MTQTNPLPANADSLTYVLFHLGVLFAQGRLSPEEIRTVLAPIDEKLSRPELPSPSAMPAMLKESVVEAPPATEQAPALPVAAEAEETSPYAGPPDALVPVLTKPEGYKSATALVADLDADGKLTKFYRLSGFSKGGRPQRSRDRLSPGTLGPLVGRLARLAGIYPIPHDKSSYQPVLVPPGMTAVVSLVSGEKVDGKVVPATKRLNVVYSPASVEVLRGRMLQQAKYLLQNLKTQGRLSQWLQEYQNS